MKRSTNTHSGQRVTRISHLRKGQLQKKSKPNPCVLMTGVITTILMTFIYLVTSSMHRAMMEEHAEYQQQQKQKQQQQQQENLNMNLNLNTNNNNNNNNQNNLLQQQQQQQKQQQIQHEFQNNESLFSSKGIRNNRSNNTPDFQINPPKFVTVVLPSVVNPKGRSKRLHAISKTWGPHSNAIFITHDDGEYDPNSNINNDVHYLNNYNMQYETDDKDGGRDKSNHQQRNREKQNQDQEDEFSSMVNQKENINFFPQVLKVPESIATIDQGVPRLQYVIETIYKEYNPDYAFFVNDHTFVIPQHMCKFLSEQEQIHQQQQNTNNNNSNDNKSSFHFYAGHALKPKGTNYAFNSGAAGYFLSRTTMQTLILKQNNAEREKDCKGERKWLQGNPGLVTANCLKVVMGVDPVDTRDEHGRHLFHAYGILRTVKGDFDTWYTKKHEMLKEIWGEDRKLNKYELTKGKECCSPNTISFHYVEFAETFALHATLQKIMEVGGADNITDEELKEFIIKVWPSQKKDIGGYSHNLPPVSRKDVWSDFLYVVKMIAPKTPVPEC